MPHAGLGAPMHHDASLHIEKRRPSDNPTAEVIDFESGLCTCQVVHSVALVTRFAPFLLVRSVVIKDSRYLREG